MCDVQVKYLPSFTADEKALLKKSYDYMGLTIYTAKYAAEVPDNPNGWWIKTEDPNGKYVAVPFGALGRELIAWMVNFATGLLSTLRCGAST